MIINLAESPQLHFKKATVQQGEVPVPTQNLWGV